MPHTWHGTAARHLRRARKTSTPTKPALIINPELRIRLFGHVAVELDGAPFRLATPRKTLPILAYLLMNRDAPVARDFLAYVMWPDEEEGSARSKLRMNLYDLGRILPAIDGGALQVSTDSVGVRPDLPLWLDVEEFDRLVGDPQRLEEALALYRGDLLASLYDEWILPERERRRNLYLAGLARLVSDARRRRDFPLGLERAQRILALDPWREDIVRQVMALRSESGDRAGALAEFERFAQLLRSDLGVDPMPETLTVRETIARGDSVEGDTADDPTNPAMLSRAATLPFVGRRAELDRLLEAWSRVARGRGAFVFIGGEAGVGKSRLSIEFAHAVEERGGRVLVGATGSPEAMPYESVVDALRSALPLVASLKPTMSLACISALLPEIRARLPSLPTPPQIDAESERIRLFESVFRALADLSEPRPLLIVLEDLQWAGAASISLLQFLLRRISGVRAMVVVTYRDDETPRPHPLHRLRQEARAAGSTLSLSLSPLSIGDLEQLTGAIHEIREIPAATLLATSAGNPLFVTQLVDDYRKGGRAFEPETLQVLVARRIEHLSPDARRAAEIAAGIGVAFSRDAVREVSGWDDATLREALDELIDRRIVRETSGRGLFEYAFAHHVLHDAVMRAAPPERAAIRQHRIARVLEELYPDRFSELSPAIALHYELAGDGANAARCYQAAVLRSMTLGALAEARDECDRAIALTQDPYQRAELLLELATIEGRRANRGAWETAIETAENAIAHLDDPNLKRTALMRRIEFALSTNDGTALEKAIAELRVRAQDGDRQSKVALGISEARLAYALGRLADSYAAAQTALDLSREANDGAAAAQALTCLANVEAHRGRLTEADVLLEDATRAATEAGDHALERDALRCAWTVSYQRRNMQRCVELGMRLLELSDASGDRFAEAVAHSRLGIVLASVGGRSAEARRHLAASTEIFSEHGNISATAGELLNRAVLETRVGFFDRAREATRQAVELFDRVGDARGRLTGLGNLVLVGACERDLEGARQAARDALEAARELGFSLVEAAIIENLAVVEAADGDYAGAIAYAEASLELRKRSQSQVWSAKTLGDLAIWHAAIGKLDRAAEYVRRMLDHEDTFMRSTEWPELCYFAAAQVFRLLGETAKSSGMLEQARKIMESTAQELDPEDRERFLGIAWHRDIAAAAGGDLWPDPPR